MIHRAHQLRLEVCAALISPLFISCAAHRAASTAAPPERADRVAEPGEAASPTADGDREKMARTALAKKLARQQTFANGFNADSGDHPESYAEQDWIKHSIDGGDNGPPPFTAFATARNDWFGLLGRPAFGTGKWVPFGPTNGQNDLTNVFRDRTVYGRHRELRRPDRARGHLAGLQARAGHLHPLDRRVERRRVAHRQRAGRG